MRPRFVSRPTTGAGLVSALGVVIATIALGLPGCSSGGVAFDASPLDVTIQVQCDDATPCPGGYVCQTGICYVADLMLTDVPGGPDVPTPPPDLPQDLVFQDKVVVEDVPIGQDPVIGEDVTIDEPPPVDMTASGGCPAPADCSNPDCEGRSCGQNGLRCMGGTCKCPGGQTRETSCGDGQDNDCDGLVDCADPDCNTRSCGNAQMRCCGNRCVDTSNDEQNCGGCGIVCRDPDGTGARAPLCRRVTDGDGTRGHCECVASTMCNNNPGQICRAATAVPEQNNLCACNDATGCAAGQQCSDVAGANFCHY